MPLQNHRSEDGVLGKDITVGDGGEEGKGVFFKDAGTRKGNGWIILKISRGPSRWLKMERNIFLRTQEPEKGERMCFRDVGAKEEYRISRERQKERT